MLVDCAVAEIDVDTQWSNSADGGQRISDAGEPALEMEVEKFGRTTGHTVGTITSVAFGVGVPYEDPAGQTIEVNFAEQVTITTSDGSPFSSPGDSGSVVLQRGTGTAVALVTAGTGTYTMANPIRRVLYELGELDFA
ncbi:MAG: hypothetical protein JWM87_4093 [Candidatus Eremiobacteraeota bacterium]|nr:hypothetical protein [Candidatus Eremiobacteraeota bacterium]